jgi:hypothetical protein
VIGNKMRGQGRGVKVQLFHTALMPTTPSAYIAIEQNEFANMVTEPIAIQKTGATINDFVLIGRNVTRLRESWPAHKLDTSANLVKYRNQCIHPSNPTSALRIVTNELGSTSRRVRVRPGEAWLDWL